MQTPIREQIRLDGRWQARRLDSESVSVFVPGSWTEKKVLLRPGEKGEPTAAEANGEHLASDQEEPGWQADPSLQLGHWNTVRVSGGLEGTRLVARDELHITRLEASPGGKNGLAVRICLHGGKLETPGLLILDFSLTATDGQHVGGMSVAVGSRTRDISLEMPVTVTLHGVFRLKATLSHGDRVVDNARIDLELE